MYEDAKERRRMIRCTAEFEDSPAKTVRVPYMVYRHIVSGRYGWTPEKIQESFPGLTVDQIAYVISSMGRKPTAAERQEIMVRLKVGQRPRDIASSLGVKVKSVLWTRDVLLPIQGTKLRCAIRDRIRQLNVPPSEIADEFQVPVRCVKYLKSQLGAEGLKLYRWQYLKRRPANVD